MFLIFSSCFIYIFIYISNSCMCAEITEKNVLSNLTRREESEFVFLYPRTFLAGKNETVCSVFQSKYFPARIKMVLKVKNKQFTFNEVLNSDAECFNLSVPLHRSLEILSADLSINVEVGGTVQIKKSYELIPIYPPTDVIFMETDRQIYAPGDKVQIRLIVLTQDMLPNLKNFTNIDTKIINPQGFIVHAVQLKTNFGMVHFDYQLANETASGTWNIEVNSYRKSFLVKKLILPRFKIYINAPKGIYTEASYLQFKVCARYTFGNGLRGYSFSKITYYHDITFSLSKLQALNSDGCTEFIYQNNELLLSKHHLKSNLIKVFVTVTEDGTNQMMTETLQIKMYPKPFEIKILPEASYFQPGLPYKNKLKIIHGFLMDYSKEYAEICCQIAWKHEWNLKSPECESFQFDKDGVIPFSILPLKENVKYVKITAKSLNYTTILASEVILHRWYSSSPSYLKIDRNSKLYTKCRSPQQFTVYFTINKLRNNERVTFYYMISSYNDILSLKKHYHTVNKTFIDFQSEIGNTISTHKNYTKMENYVDKFVLKFKTHKRIYSKGQLTVFYINNGETISNSINIFVEKCLSMNITARWARSSIKPRDTAHFSMQSTKNAVCALSAVDIANNFLDSHKRLTVNKILQPFAMRRDFKMKKPNCIFDGGQFKDVMLPGSPRDFNYSPSFDTFEDFNHVGIAVITNTAILAKPCKQHDDLVAPYYQISTDDEYDKYKQEEDIIIRSYFPATWIWTLFDKRGVALLTSTAPDTITTWNTNLICISNDGIGVANFKLITTKPFFVDFVLPQSIKRFEILTLQIAAHNYYNYSLPIKLTLNTSLDILNQDSIKDIISVAANEVVIKTIKLRASQISTAYISVTMQPSYNNMYWNGKYWEKHETDIIEKHINVIYEGYKQVKPKSILLCGTAEQRNFTWNFDIAEDYIQGSENTSIVFYSDLMGPAFHNLEELIILPTGCGEQIMAVMAPNFYVLKYLKSINNLLPFIRKRIFKNLQIGYQKILGFRHNDGSFSAFGQNDNIGSMFLTTFVLRSLTSASEYIFVDKLIISNALEWILKYQLENGCFASVSHVFQDMSGATMENSTSALTSYVMISLLESKINISEQTQSNAVYCIRGQFNPDVFSLAINTYALYLLGAEEAADEGLQLLIQSANQQNNLMWWNSTKDSRSMNVEITSYVLMSLMHKLSNDNLIYANAIVRWLSSQRNAQGGFISSQDTVVALDAISRYTSIMHERNPVMDITISTSEATYTVNFKNGDPLKKEEFYFSQQSKSVHLLYNGTGCVLTQLLLHYNVNSPRNTEVFELNINPISATSNCLISTLTPCFKYNNKKPPTMIVMEIFMPSGYDSEKSSLHQIVGSYTNLKKVEEISNKLVFYFTDITTEAVCLPFNISRTAMVSTLYNSTILLYEYYNPDQQIIKAYNLPNECSTVP